MADYSEEEPEGLWDSIMDQLPDQARPAGPGSGRKTVRIIVLTAAAAASAAVILLSGGPEIGTAPIYPYAIADAGHTVMASIPEASAIPEFSRPGQARNTRRARMKEKCPIAMKTGHSRKEWISGKTATGQAESRDGSAQDCQYQISPGRGSSTADTAQYSRMQRPSREYLQKTP